LEFVSQLIRTTAQRETMHALVPCQGRATHTGQERRMMPV
jgi:hypothetical protein